MISSQLQVGPSTQTHNESISTNKTEKAGGHLKENQAS